MRRRLILFLFVLAMPWQAGAQPAGASAAGGEHALSVDVQRKGDTLDVHVSFALPLSRCQAWAFLTDYDSIREIPGVLEARSERIDPTTIRLERVVTERVLVYDLKFHSLMEARELPGVGLDFVQIKGDMKRYSGTWRIESAENRSVFRYRAQLEPDSFLPMAVIRAATQAQMERSFAAMARIGMRHGSQSCS